jgi:hypothetical protein
MFSGLHQPDKVQNRGQDEAAGFLGGDPCRTNECRKYSLPRIGVSGGADISGEKRIFLCRIIVFISNSKELVRVRKRSLVAA